MFLDENGIVVGGVIFVLVVAVVLAASEVVILAVDVEKVRYGSSDVCTS